MSLQAAAESAFGDGGEHAAAAFLKQHPELLLWSTVHTGGNLKYVLSEFWLGSRFRTDFVVVLAYSGAWDVHLIELGRVNTTPIL